MGFSVGLMGVMFGFGDLVIECNAEGLEHQGLATAPAGWSMILSGESKRDRRVSDVGEKDLDHASNDRRTKHSGCTPLLVCNFVTSCNHFCALGCKLKGSAKH